MSSVMTSPWENCCSICLKESGLLKATSSGKDRSGRGYTMLALSISYRSMVFVSMLVIRKEASWGMGLSRGFDWSSLRLAMRLRVTTFRISLAAFLLAFLDRLGSRLMTVSSRGLLDRFWGFLLTRLRQILMLGIGLYTGFGKLGMICTSGVYVLA